MRERQIRPTAFDTRPEICSLVTEVKHTDNIDGYDVPYLSLLRTRTNKNILITTLQKELIVRIKLPGLVIHCAVLCFVVAVGYVADFKHCVSYVTGMYRYLQILAWRISTQFEYVVQFRLFSCRVCVHNFNLAVH